MTEHPFNIRLILLEAFSENLHRAIQAIFARHSECFPYCLLSIALRLRKNHDKRQTQRDLADCCWIPRFLKAVWFPSDDKTLNISWMMKILESSTTIVSTSCV